MKTSTKLVTTQQSVVPTIATTCPLDATCAVKTLTRVTSTIMSMYVLNYLHV